MKLHLMSDAHMEALYDWEYPKPMVTGDVCVLAGDMCTAVKAEKVYAPYLEFLKEQFDEILIVNGNHEFYRSHYEDGLQEMKRIADQAGAHLLDVELGTESFEYKGVKFWGSTLWTDMGRGEFAKEVEWALNDFRLIGGMNIERAMEIYHRTVEKIDWSADVVITHHMPIFRKHSRFDISPVSYGFGCTELEERIAESSIKYWLYGHTHDNAHHAVEGTQIVSNQVGYSREYMVNSYDPHFILEV